MLAPVLEPPTTGHCPSTVAPEVVVIGTSAGGLEALQRLLPLLRPNKTTAYVVVQHMGSDSQHLVLQQLLQRTCALPVELMKAGEPPQSDTVHLVPSGGHARWENGHWTLSPPSSQFVYTPSVDVLLLSLAQGLGKRAAAVILSGAGSDGAIGAAELHLRGGRVWVQAPQQARFDGMPRAVMAAVPDAQTLHIEDMPNAWSWWSAHNVMMPTPPSGELAALLERVKDVTGVDFTGYKPERLERRTARRLQELGVPTLKAYLSRVNADPEEAWTLQSRFLVSVSSFFRDRAAFTALGEAWRQQPPTPGQSWRCWVPACATGEEAYTLAMLYDEGIRDGAWTGTVEVVGTDLNAEALSLAEQARYGSKALKEVDHLERDRYFLRDGDNYDVISPILTSVRFERQNLLTQQPDGPWDVISCRNLLIYLQASLQERLIADFHARMAPGGWLFISPAETLPLASLRLFACHDLTHRIYRRLP